MSDQPGYEVIRYINFTGGFPGKVDFAPSIVFLVAYALVTPLFLYRIFHKPDRTVLLIRPGIFYGCRIAMLIIRAIMAKTDYKIGLLIAELVLVSIGYLFLIEPLISLWRRHVETHVPRAQHPVWVKALSWILFGLLITSIITVAVSGAVTSDAFTSQAWRNAVRALRECSYILSLAVVVCLLAALFWTHFHFSLPLAHTLYIAAPTCCMLIVATYRVAQTFESNPDSAARTKAAFWVLQVFFEYCAFIFVIAISLPKWYPGDSTPKTSKSRKGSDGTVISRGDPGKAEAGQREVRKRPWYLKGPITKRIFTDYDD